MSRLSWLEMYDGTGYDGRYEFDSGLPALRDVADEGDEGSLAACDLCGETYSHDHTEDEYGSFRWDDDTDGGERPVGVYPDEPF